LAPLIAASPPAAVPSEVAKLFAGRKHANNARTAKARRASRIEIGLTGRSQFELRVNWRENIWKTV